MIRLKTSVLLGGALQIGSILGGASEQDALALYQVGVKAGLAFQLQDDFLDVYGDPKVFGKNIGGDILCNKKTFMLLSAQNMADAETREELLSWIKREDYVPAEKISAVTYIYNKVGIDDVCRAEINRYYDEAMACLDQVSVSEERKANLKNYLLSLMGRNL